jgi:hypothetical protein
MFGYTLIKKTRLRYLEDMRVETLEKYFTELFTYYPEVAAELQRRGVTVEKMKLHMYQWAADWLFYGDGHEVDPYFARPSDPLSRPQVREGDGEFHP